MALHKITKGLDLPIKGSPEQVVTDGPTIARVAIVASDFVGMKPRMQVLEGDDVLRGQPLFEDRKNPGVVFTAPGAGRVTGINRGDRRALQSVVIELNEREQAGTPADDDFFRFKSYTGAPVADLSRDQVRDLLVESGQWVGLRARPFDRVASPATVPHSIFVTAIDTRPHAPDVSVALEGREADFERGLVALSKLTDGALFLCRAPGVNLGTDGISNLRIEEFSGPHPAGLPGTHIHMLDPVSRGKTVWHIGYADVAAVGHLVATGRIDVARVISLAGPVVDAPRLLRTRAGADIGAIVEGGLAQGDNRVISGSVLDGTPASGDILGYLGRYTNQVAALREGRQREFLGWLRPGFDIFSIMPTFLSKLLPGSDNVRFDLTTSTMGSERAMVPIGTYEQVMPLDILPTFLLRSLISGDLEKAEQLGALELSEEDVALCTVVCPGKYDYGPILRKTLATIEAEG